MGVFFNCVSCSLVATRRRTTVESAEGWNGSWCMARTRGVGLFRLLSAPICMYCRKKQVSVWNTKVYTFSYYVGTFIYCVINSYSTRYIRVYVQMEMVECYSIILLTYDAFIKSLLRSLSLVFRTTMRRNLLVSFSRKMAWHDFMEWLRFSGYQ